MNPGETVSPVFSYISRSTLILYQIMPGVVPGDARRFTKRPLGPIILGSTNSKVLLVLGPRVIHHISFESYSTADSRGRETVSALRSCMLVCRAWAPVARRYLHKTALFRVWFLAVQQLKCISNHSSLCIPPAAYPFLRAARSMFRNPLPKVPLDIALSSVTSVVLGSWRSVIACDVDGLCRTIASLAPLRDLQLMNLAWAGSRSNNSHLPVTPHSRARLHGIIIWAERYWLLDLRSAHFITWLAQSGTASKLSCIRFDWMMILEERLLAAVAAVIDASKHSLRRLYLGVGLDLAIHSRKYPWSFTTDPRLISNFAVAPPISQCISLYQLFIKLPHHHITAFLHLIAFLMALRLGQLRMLDLQFLSYPSRIEPPVATWERLDMMLQTPQYQFLERVAILEMGKNTELCTITWGDFYPDSPYDPVACRRKMAELLPLTRGRHRLFYWDDPYGLPERVPNRVRPFLPVEVAERVMDFIAGMEESSMNLIWSEGVPATLAACSLTCQDWKPRAQAHLFCAVKLHSAKHKNFLSLLAQHPALGPFICTCTVKDTPSPPSKSPSLHNAPFQLLSVLPRLEHLQFSIGTFYPPPRIPFEACMRRSSSIVRLWLHKVAFYSINDLRRMVSACRNMKNLRLFFCEWRGKPKATVTDLRSLTSVRLTEVSIFGDAGWLKDLRSASFLRWLVHSGMLVSAELIHLPRVIAGAGDMLAASQSVIHACHSTLKNVGLELSPDINYDCCEFALNQDSLS